MKRNTFIYLFLVVMFSASHSLYGQENDKIKAASESRTEQVEELDNKLFGKNIKQKEEILLREFETKKAVLYNANSKEVTQDKQSELQQVIDVMSIEIPSSFTYNYAVYDNSNHSINAYENLETAFQLEPNNPITYEKFIAHAEITKNDELKKEFCEKLDNSKRFNSAQLEYNQNVLHSVEESSYLITNGSTDTYPAWIQQEQYFMNKDVTILNLELLQNKGYRSRIFNEMGITESIENPSSDQIVSQIISNKKNGEIYLGLTIPHNILIKHSNHLWVTGLALCYNEYPDKNYMDELNNIWLSKFTLSHINDYDNINKNYLLMLKNLHQYYKAIENKKERKKIEHLIENICSRFQLSNPIEG